MASFYLHINAQNAAADVFWWTRESCTLPSGHPHTLGAGPCSPVTVMSLHMCEGVSSAPHPASPHHCSNVIFGLGSSTVILVRNNRSSWDLNLPFCAGVHGGVFFQTLASLSFCAGWFLKQWTPVPCRWWPYPQPLIPTRYPAPAACEERSMFSSLGRTTCTTLSRVFSPPSICATGRDQLWWWGETAASSTKPLLKSLCRWQLPTGSVPPRLFVCACWLCVCVCVCQCRRSPQTPDNLLACSSYG